MQKEGNSSQELPQGRVGVAYVACACFSLYLPHYLFIRLADSASLSLYANLEYSILFFHIYILLLPCVCNF